METILRLALPVLPQLMGLVTPALRVLLDGLLRDLHAKARQTDNPVDDVVVGLLAGLLGLDLAAGERPADQAG